MSHPELSMTYYLACLLTLAAGYLVNILYITVFYHRGLTHSAVELAPWLRRFVVKTGNWITGLDPKGWSVMHRLHHQYSDTALDPHSPTTYGIAGVMMAQLNSYKKILRGLKRHDPQYLAVASDLDFEVHWLNRYKLWVLPYALHASIALVLGVVFHAWLLGLAYWLGIMSHPLQGWLVNSFGHSSGYRNFHIGDDSRNNTLIALLVMGEGYQNNHHRYQIGRAHV